MSSSTRMKQVQLNVTSMCKSSAHVMMGACMLLICLPRHLEHPWENLHPMSERHCPSGSRSASLPFWSAAGKCHDATALRELNAAATAPQHPLPDFRRPEIHKTTASEGKKKRKWPFSAEARSARQWRPLQSKTKYIQHETVPADMLPHRLSH